MPLSVGDPLPQTQFLMMVDNDPVPVAAKDWAGSGRAVLFGMPGAFTGTCTSLHVPSILADLEGIRAAGAQKVGITAVNDPFTMAAFGETSGASAGGIDMLGDAEAAFAEHIGTFSNPVRGLINRSVRYALIAENGIVRWLEIDEPGPVCTVSGGASVLDALRAMND